MGSNPTASADQRPLTSKNSWGPLICALPAVARRSPPVPRLSGTQGARTQFDVIAFVCLHSAGGFLPPVSFPVASIPSAFDPHVCGAVAVQGVKVERATVRTTLTPWAVAARLAWVDGSRDGSPLARHDAPAPANAPPAIPEPERPRRRLVLTRTPPHPSPPRRPPPLLPRSVLVLALGLSALVPAARLLRLACSGVCLESSGTLFGVAGGGCGVPSSGVLVWPLFCCARLCGWSKRETDHPVRVCGAGPRAAGRRGEDRRRAGGPGSPVAGIGRPVV